VDGGVIKVIWGKRKQEYLFERDWTTQITLIGLSKLDFTRKSAGRSGNARSLDETDGRRGA